ncbi:hypothetical protein FHL15_005915 [Xylaria flabelliformis]|uniref:tRNA synthetases class I catalytic domain-containing protein n=1 Tax=Xylaria flabelliformis TaxID=2512241 RepID=A0A553HZE8_9PEZI|nr:hypothetical protein FHL15_005915 [Xylaria flabelliformis]
MNDYFGLWVMFVVNTTDIDDKIIIQGRQQYLLACFKQEHTAEDDSVSDSILVEVEAAFWYYIGGNLPSLPANTTLDTFPRPWARCIRLLTRVTEHVPQIVRFVEEIVADGFGYATTDGSVYFDIDSFEKTGHSYTRLGSWNKNDGALQADGEGSLSREYQ